MRNDTGRRREVFEGFPDGYRLQMLRMKAFPMLWTWFKIKMGILTEAIPRSSPKLALGFDIAKTLIRTFRKNGTTILLYYKQHVQQSGAMASL